MSAETRPGTIGIIGAGHIGQAFARVAQRGGREVLIANSRGPESYASTEREVEISAVIGASKGLATAAVRTARLPQTDASAPVGGASR